GVGLVRERGEDDERFGHGRVWSTWSTSSTWSTGSTGSSGPGGTRGTRECSIVGMPRFPGRTALLLAVGGALWTAPGGARSRSGPELPPIVFVSRVPLPDSLRGQVPGLGPHGTFSGAGGRLLERESDGRVRELVPPGQWFAVADPAVSDDGTRVAFAARERADSPWRVWTVGRALAVQAGSGALACATCDEAGVAGDDADPVWWGDTLLYVSTRGAR